MRSSLCGWRTQRGKQFLKWSNPSVTQFDLQSSPWLSHARLQCVCMLSIWGFVALSGSCSLAALTALPPLAWVLISPTAWPCVYHVPVQIVCTLLKLKNNWQLKNEPMWDEGRWMLPPRPMPSVSLPLIWLFTVCQHRTAIHTALTFNTDVCFSLTYSSCISLQTWTRSHSVHHWWNQYKRKSSFLQKQTAN